MRVCRAWLFLPAVFLFSTATWSQGRGGAPSQPLTQSITVRGRVVDAETGSSVLDARVTLIATGGQNGGQGGSNMGSDFEFDNIPTATLFELKVEADGYQTYQQFFQPTAAGMNGYMTIPLRKVKFVESPPKGKVVDARLLQLSGPAREAYQSGMTQLYEKNDPTKSMAFFERTLKLAPAFYEAHYQMGVAHQNLKQTSEAISAYQEAERGSEGKYAPAEFALASLLSEQQKFSDAEAAARKGLVANPKSAAGHYELARSLMGQGKAPEAETEAKASLELTPLLPQNYLLLAAVDANRGQPEPAIEQLDAYLKAVPTGAVADSVRALRESLAKQLPAERTTTAQPPKPQ